MRGKSRPSMAYILCEAPCALVNLLRRSLESVNGDSDLIAMRVLRSSLINGLIEYWLRVSSSDTRLMKYFTRLLSKSGYHHRIVYKGKDNIVLWLRFTPSSSCSKCHVFKPPSGVMFKTIFITPYGILHEALSVNNNIRSSMSCDSCSIIVEGGLNEVMKYLLTSREQEILYLAYARGYYDMPRRVSLEDLAREAGVSLSTLNEILRSAEKKVMDAFIKHDLPHLVVGRMLKLKGVLSKSQHRREYTDSIGMRV